MKVDNREVGINEVMPGAVLAADVRDTAGNLLLPQGAAVTASVVSSLKRRGIATLHIVEERPPEEEAESRRRAQERIQFLFRASGDNPATRELERQVAAYRLQGQQE